VRFLSESALINRDQPIINLGGTRQRHGFVTPTTELEEYALTLGSYKLEKIVLPGADLSNTALDHVNMTSANLPGVDLTGADLRGAVLTGADLTGAELRGTNPH